MNGPQDRHLHNFWLVRVVSEILAAEPLWHVQNSDPIHIFDPILNHEKYSQDFNDELIISWWTGSKMHTLVYSGVLGPRHLVVH